MPKVQFCCKGTAFKLPKPRKTSAWIQHVCEDHGASIESITFIFCTDKYLHQINLDYLGHDTLTDIITFDNSDTPGRNLDGDIFISIQRVKENAKVFNKSFQEELHRVMIHGILHLLGFKDKSKKDREEMRRKEDLCLSLSSVPRETFT